MELRETLWGNTNPRTVFSPQGNTQLADGAPLRTTIKWRWLKDKLEDVGYIKPEHYQQAGIDPGDAARGASQGLETGPRAALAGGSAGVAAVASDNPIYGGLYSQMLMRKHGFQVPPARPVELAQAPVASMVDEVAPAAAEAAAKADAPIASAADDAAARIAALEQRFIEGFQRLGQLPAEQRIPALARAVDAGAAAGHGDDAFGVLASSLASRPLEHSADALHTSIDDALKAAAPKAAEVVEKAAPVADEAAKVAASADHPLLAAARTQLADDLANGTLQHLDDTVVPLLNTKLGAVQLVTKTDLAAALGKAAPVVEEVAKVAPVVDEVVKGAPVAEQAIAKALPAGDDALRYGLKGVMGLQAGIDDTLRLLAKIR